jgi:dehydrogenase/reductase SDR family protein 7B
MDMTNYADVRKITASIIGRLEKKNRKLDVVIENAGVSMRCEFTNYAFENHISLFDVNVHGPYNHIQAFVPHMIKHKSGQIVGISSLSGKISTAYRSSYGGSKHALIGILDSLRTEFQPYGIKVCNVMPGYIKTNISKNAMSSGAGQKFGVTDGNIEKGMDPARFAKEAVGAIFNKENEVSIGDQWVPLIGLVFRNICPDLIFKFLLHNAKNQSKAIAEGKKEE